MFGNYVAIKRKAKKAKSMYVRMYACMHAYKHACIDRYAWMDACMYIHACNINKHACNKHVCMHVWMYV